MIGDSVLALLREEMRRVLREELHLAIQELRSATPLQKEFLSVTEAAELDDISETTVREWMANGLRHYKQGRVVRLGRAELLAFLSATGNECQEEEANVERQANAILARRRGG